MPIFFIAAIGLLLFFLFLQRLSQANTRVLSDVLKWTSVTLLLIAFTLFILSGRVIYATLLLIITALFFLSHRGRWKRTVQKKRLQLLHLLTYEEACAILDLKKSQPLSVKKIEKAYQKKWDALTSLKVEHLDQERARLTQAKDFLIILTQEGRSSPSDSL